jgi:hypothetical protein
LLPYHPPTGLSACLPHRLPAAEGTAKSAAEAEAVMKAERPRVRLNRRQMSALQAWVALRGAGDKQE